MTSENKEIPTNRVEELIAELEESREQAIHNDRWKLYDRSARALTLLKAVEEAATAIRVIEDQPIVGDVRDTEAHIDDVKNLDIAIAAYRAWLEETR